VESRSNALLIPVNAIRETQGVRLVWVVGPGDTAVERTVQAQQRIGNTYLVTSGLQAGDEVIVGGQQKLRPGDKIKPQLVTPGQLGEDSRDAQMLHSTAQGSGTQGKGSQQQAQPQ
jgi:hypothetical protein